MKCEIILPTKWVVQVKKKKKNSHEFYLNYSQILKNQLQCS